MTFCSTYIFFISVVVFRFAINGYNTCGSNIDAMAVHLALLCNLLCLILLWHVTAFSYDTSNWVLLLPSGTNIIPSIRFASDGSHHCRGLMVFVAGLCKYISPIAVFFYV
jgi:hypothetical protein